MINEIEFKVHPQKYKLSLSEWKIFNQSLAQRYWLSEFVSIYEYFLWSREK